MRELERFDLRHVVERLPRDIRNLLSVHPRRLYVAGGFVRAIVAGEQPADIGIFGHDIDLLRVAAKRLVEDRPGSRIHESKNAITVLSPDRMPVQFILRWTFETAAELVASFDFSVCQAAVWRSGRQSNDAWFSEIGDRFYVDLAARRLHYTAPARIEEAGGSLLRAIKYVKRGYTIQVGDLGAVVARAITHPEVHGAIKSGTPEGAVGCYIADVLREVDPMLAVDGLEVSFDHETEDPVPLPEDPA